MNPTPQQQDFLNDLVGTSSHLALVARAGCGKTSTILLGVDEIVKKFPRAEVAVCAYNKAIADEVQEKLKARGHADWRRVQASTLHSMGFSLLKYIFKPEIDEKKVAKLVDAQNDPVYEQFRTQIITLVGYAKGAGVGFFSDLPVESSKTWFDLAEHYDVNGVDDMMDMELLIACCRVIYRKSLNQTNVIDFDDMILLPLIKNITVKFGKDFLFLDEAQDLSRARQALARKFLKPRTGRMIVVGDDRQAIYGFSGADAQALPNLIESLGAVVKPLSITWRCPKAVVAVAQQYVPDIQAAPSAPEGVVRTLDLLPGVSDEAKRIEAEWVADLRPGDAILCRNTAPLITVAYKLIRAGKACRVEGREIGKGLLDLARRWKVTTLAAFEGRLETYREREIQKAMAKGDERKAEEVDDKCGTVSEIIKACRDQGKTTVAELEQFIQGLFADGAENVVVLATYHRSKGREWPRVFLWQHSQRCPSRAAKKEWQLSQEDNLAYVAITRAQQELVWVEGGER